jgi:hypothetical protein
VNFDMGEHSLKIDALLTEANDCELIGSLATTREVRETNRARAQELRKLAQEIRKLDRVPSDACLQENRLSDRG